MKVGKAICISIGNFDQNSSFVICQQTRLYINYSIIPVCKSKWKWNSESFPIGIPIGKADGFNQYLSETVYDFIKKKDLAPM